jgi:hypothetical protein
MKTIQLLRKITFILIAVLYQTASVSQEKFNLVVFQDAKLFFLGDQIGNDAGTLDLLLKAEIQGKQKKLGYPVLYIAYKRANLRDLYTRYLVDIGYTFNNFGFQNYFLRQLEVTPSFGYGQIRRQFNQGEHLHYGWSLSTQISYRINPTIRIAV